MHILDRNGGHGLPHRLRQVSNSALLALIIVLLEFKKFLLHFNVFIMFYALHFALFGLGEQLLSLDIGPNLVVVNL